VTPFDRRGAWAGAKARATSLAKRTSFRIGGVPEFLFEPETEAEAGEVLAACRREGIALRILGGGCNLLVSDGRLEGAVMATSRIRFERVLDDAVEVGAGVSFSGLVQRSASLGVPVLSGCYGIPGSVGGVVAMNAGGKFGCAGDALVRVRGFDAAGRSFARAVEPGDLGYRQTAFEGMLVTSAAFRRDANLDVDAARRLYAAARDWKQRTQPLSAFSAGCVFKNPEAATSAGAIIDALGLKGARVGDAVVSPLHANFIVNDGLATFADVSTLIDRIQTKALTERGVALDLEVKVWR
jgi:UDP-N-acetylmuramate dehydrogenase